MSSKYHGLPDIDTAADVFETSDEPESILKPNDNGLGEDENIVKPISEDIDGASLPQLRKAQKVFGRGSKRPDPTFTFRPRLPPLTSHSYGGSSDEEEEEVVRETPAVRLRRLKAELEELEKELASQPVAAPPRIQEEGKRKSVLPPREPVDLLAELSSLQTRVAGVDIGDSPIPAWNGVTGDGVGGAGWKERLEKLSSQPLPNPGDAPKEGEGPRPVAGLGELDKRLAVLEGLVGPSDTAVESASSPLLSTLSKHDHLLSLLTQPRHLDAISRRVKLLLVDLDRAATAARRQGGSQITPQPGDKTVTLSNADYASLQSLFTLLPRLDPLLPVIPPLLARLRILAGLHTVAGEVASGLTRLQESVRASGEEVKELKEVVEGVQRGLDDAGKSIIANWEGVEKRMKDLEERITKLNE